MLDGFSDIGPDGPDCDASGTPDEGCCPVMPPGDPLGDVWPMASVVAPANASVNNHECVFISCFSLLVLDPLRRARSPR